MDGIGAVAFDGKAGVLEIRPALAPEVGLCAAGAGGGDDHLPNAGHGRDGRFGGGGVGGLVRRFVGDHDAARAEKGCNAMEGAGGVGLVEEHEAGVGEVGAVDGELLQGELVHVRLEEADLRKIGKEGARFLQGGGAGVDTDHFPAGSDDARQRGEGAEGAAAEVEDGGAFGDASAAAGIGDAVFFMGCEVDEAAELGVGGTEGVVGERAIRHERIVTQRISPTPFMRKELRPCTPFSFSCVSAGKEIETVMTVATRMILILMLMLAFAGGLSAQETSTVAETSGTASTTAAETTSTTATETAAAESTTTNAEDGEAAPRPRTSYEIRSQFTYFLRESLPYELSMILKLDPMLLTNDTFVAGYPELVRFLEKNPEIRRNPRFYLGEIPIPGRSGSVLDDIIESLAVLFGIVLTVAAFAWFVRTIIDQRRWNRLSRTQTEVHNKILDRFGSSEELLQYIKSPAGERFLESAPIPLHSEPAPAQNTPFSRVILSVQIGVIVTAAALGLLLISIRHSNETGQGLFALGAIALSIGLGFIGSAAISMFLSRRLGLWKPPHSSAVDESGPVR